MFHSFPWTLRWFKYGMEVESTGRKWWRRGWRDRTCWSTLRKPRRCCFQIHEEGGGIFVTPLNMNRPLTVMKALDMGWRAGLEDIADINECLERKAKANETNGDNKYGSETRMWIMRLPLPRKYILISRTVQWINAETALNHEWLHEVHFPNFKEFMLTFPAQHTKNRVNMKFFIMNLLDS
ncbi:unnamed protein product [Fraxinus pennsylvanica]|uniref:Uncharacterized protein n=1 Tax=Fraxinus pennsylvanica TaxID=56036 RepID=A0AAD2DI14_9LAMI|nr:unnamed protein product [Fraxinus pennsylvanica]